ncbi:SDR family oxidoreductase [Paenibacillus puerhi]|uniref:SDR family oxidoreductase n=1 Tax=Paenibacillus puerhi TaxID=2692622 RepID=UPI00191699D6|nr:SDR family oxidoreductase [Paenibacillus puerhi]
MKIGVNGASGQLGGATVKELLERAAGQHSVVAITRSPEKIAIDGVEARFGDYNQPSSMIEAYKGLDRLLLIPSSEVKPGHRSEQFIAAIDAAVEAGVPHIVLVSSAGVRNTEKSNIAYDYFVGEQHLIRKASKWSILRMNYYAESFIMDAQMSLAHGVLPGFTENKVAFVSRDDIAAAAAGLLLGDDHDGAIYNGTGPESLTGAQRAELITKTSSKPVSFITVPVETLQAQLQQVGLPAEIINLIVSSQQNFSTGDFDIVTGDIEKLSGRPARSLESILSNAFH